MGRRVLWDGAQPIRIEEDATERLDRGGAALRPARRGGTVVRAGQREAGRCGGSGGSRRGAAVPVEAAERSSRRTGCWCCPASSTCTRTPASPRRGARPLLPGLGRGRVRWHDHVPELQQPGHGNLRGAQRTLRDGIDEWLERTAGESAIDYGLSAVITAQQEDPTATWRTRSARRATLQGVHGLRLRDRAAPAPADAPRGRRGRRDARAALRGRRRCSSAESTGWSAPAARSPPITPRSRPVGRRGGRDRRSRRLGATTTRRSTSSTSPARRRFGRPRQPGEQVRACTWRRARISWRWTTRVPGSGPDAIHSVVSPRRCARRRSETRSGLALADGPSTWSPRTTCPTGWRWRSATRASRSRRSATARPGIETLLPLVYSEGVARGRITLERMVDVLCDDAGAPLRAAPTRAPSKSAGTPTWCSSIRQRRRDDPRADLHHTSDYTPYEGMPVQGAVRRVMVRGEDVVIEGRFVGERGAGRFIERTGPSL